MRTPMGGCDIKSPASNPLPDWTYSVITCLPRLRKNIPGLNKCSLSASPTDDGSPPLPASLREGLVHNEAVRAKHHSVMAQHAALLKRPHFTVRGGTMPRAVPKAIPVPEASSLPPLDELFNDTCKSSNLRKRVLAAVENLKSTTTGFGSESRL